MSYIMRPVIICVFSILIGNVALSQQASSTQLINQREADAKVLEELREQREEINRLRETLIEQAKIIEDLRKRVDQSGQPLTTVPASIPVGNEADSVSIRDALLKTNDMRGTSQDTTGPPGGQDARIGKIEEQMSKTSDIVSKQLGSISFSGDLRLRFEGFAGLVNADPNQANPAILGNSLSPRYRTRIRARLGIRGKISDEFEWGLRLASGSYSEALSTNQTLTDFYNRKPFGLDQAFVTYKPKWMSGLRLQGGKFEAPWVGTEATFDSDLQFEGFNQVYSRDFKNGAIKNITLAAWQLPFLERNSVFVRNDPIQSERGGRDLALYGGQLRSQFGLSPKTSLTLSIADHYFSGTHFIRPTSFFGSQIAVGTTNIPRELLVSGHANLGLSVSTNNAINRDGTFSSAFNLVDILGRLDFNQSSRFPVALLFNFITNTQVRDVVTGTGATNIILPNNENRAYWAELQVGKSKAKGDILMDYTFMRIEKDAVFTPFNFSDILIPSDVRAHRFIIAYTVDPRVVLSLNGIFSQRANGLRGVFEAEPSGSLNPYTKRLQLDTIFRF
jgi:hypothetical protein